MVLGDNVWLVLGGRPSKIRNLGISSAAGLLLGAANGAAMKTNGRTHGVAR